jgi:hypothetical protein
MASAKRKAAGRKAARTRKRNKEARRAAARKRKSLHKAGRKFKYVRVHGRRRKRRKGGGKKRRRRATHRKPVHRRRKRRYARHPRRRRRGGKLTAAIKRSHRRHGRVRRNKRGRFSKRGHTAGLIVAEKHRRRRRGRRRHHRVMENPLGGMEILVGLVTGVIGYTVSDVIDRFVVSRARTDAQGQPMGQRWDTAPLSDDWMVRGGIGLLVAAVPLGAAHFVKKPVLRSALQLFGFGAAFRLAGKIATDGATYLLKDNKDYGVRLYGTELLSRHNLGLQGLPAGLGAAPCTGCGRTDGLGGSCCRNILPKPNASPYLPPPASPTGPSPNTPPTTVPYNPPTTVFQPQQPLQPVIPQQPPLVPQQPPGFMVPGSPVMVPPSPLTAGVRINGLPGLGDATAALQAFPDAYRAIKVHAPALRAYQSGTASPAQRDVAERVTQQHAQAIATFAAIEQRQPGSIQAAARGLAGLSDPKPVARYRGVSRWSKDDAAE